MKPTLNHFYLASPSWLQDWMVSVYGRKLYKKRYTGIYHEIRALVQESRSWSPAYIEQYQAQRLHEMVRHCRRSIPYYQKLFARLGLHENDFTSTADLRKIPVLEKQTFKNETDEFRKPGSKPYIVQHTSGSTGTPLALEVDEYTYKLAMALVVDHEEHHGVPFGAPRATFAGRMVQPSSDMSPPFARMNHAENQMLFSSYHLNPETFRWFADALAEFQPEELIGYPSALCDLAKHYQQTGRKPGFKPTAVITNSETLLAWQRETMEHVFQCPVRDYYGTAEYILFAGEEEDGSYRLNPLLGVTECLDDPENNSRGTLVASTLTNTTMPLLRYNMGDSAEPAYPTMKNGVVQHLKAITGRIDDYIEAPDGRKIGRIDHIFKGLQELMEAQVIQDVSGHCTIKVVSKNARFQEHAQLERNFRNRTGGSISLSIVEVPKIDRGSNGKFKSVVRL